MMDDVMVAYRLWDFAMRGWIFSTHLKELWHSNASTTEGVTLIKQLKQCVKNCKARPFQGMYITCYFWQDFWSADWNVAFHNKFAEDYYEFLEERVCTGVKILLCFRLVIVTDTNDGYMTCN